MSSLSPASMPPEEVVRLVRSSAGLVNTLKGAREAAAASWLPGPIARFFLLSAAVAAAGTEEDWAAVEAALVAYVRVSDHEKAQQCVQLLRDRFGEENARVLALEGMVTESVFSHDGKGLERALRAYDEILEENPTNIPIIKRRIALLKSLKRTPQAVKSLIAYLNFMPHDAEAWAELADLYLSAGKYAQAVFSLEEVLIIKPNAWNIHAKVGEVLYMSTVDASVNKQAKIKNLSHSIRRFCRSIELCDDYLRGFYGLALSTHAYLQLLSKNSDSAALVKGTNEEESTPCNPKTAESLFKAAKSKLEEIVDADTAESEKDDSIQKRTTQQVFPKDGYLVGELAAAKALLAEISGLSPLDSHLATVTIQQSLQPKGYDHGSGSK